MIFNFSEWLLAEDGIVPSMRFYWISPNGKIIPSQGFGENLHIHTVINNPGLFGITKEYIEEKYKKFNEPLNSEGNARSEIMKELMEHGWVRMRCQGKQQEWTAQSAYNSHMIKNVQNWIQEMYFSRELSKFEVIRLIGLNGETTNIAVSEIIGDLKSA